MAATPANLTPSPADVTSAPPEPPALSQLEDPTICQIVPGRETVIEIQKGKSGLGLSIVGGADTLLVGEFLAGRRFYSLF